MKIRFLISIGMISALFFQILPGQSTRTVNAAQNSLEPPHYEETACKFALPPGMIEGKDIVCGNLIVAEEHQNPHGPTIQLAIATIKSRSANPAPDPLVMMQGGPGGSTIHTFINLLFSSGGRLSANRDLILLEQRGTYYSTPVLTCPEIIAETIETLNQDLSLDESLSRYEKATRACRNRLASEGVNLTAYNSLENAADIEDLRTALGYSKINLYGVSYGTLLALHTMNNYPQGLRSVILDAVVPPQINFLLQAPISENRSFEKLFSTCTADHDCNLYYPNLEKVFTETQNRLDENPAHISITDPDNGTLYPAIINGDSFRSTIFQMLYSSEIIPFLPRVIYEAADGNFNFIQRILSLTLIDRTMSYGMYYSVLCAEDSDFSPQDIQLEGLDPELGKSEQANITSFLNTCQIWNVPLFDSSVDQPVSSDIPTLILNGEFDPITPPSFGEEVAKTLPNSFSVNFPAGGHGAAMSGKCPDNIILEFLNRPDQAPDTSCIGEISAPRFISKSNTIFIPTMASLVNLEGSTGIELIIFVLGNLFLLSAPAVWLVLWFVRLLSRKQKLPAVKSTVVLRWLAVVNSLTLTTFFGAIVVLSFKLALDNNLVILFGVPSGARMFFILPLLSALLTLLMLAGAFLAWFKRYWSVWNRIYYTLVTLSAGLCVLILVKWDMLGAFLQ